MIRLWMIISWRHIDHQDDAYGRLLNICKGTEDEAKEEARKWMELHSPIGIVAVVE